MRTEDWHNILTLFTVIILIDKRIYKEEVDTFVALAIKLNSKISPDIFMTQKMAFDWFVDNRDKVKRITEAPDSERRIDQLITSLSPLPRLDSILKIMFEIARSDNDYHKSEKQVIKLAAKQWGLPLPRAH